MASKTLGVFQLHSNEEFQLWLARNEDRREELEELLGVELGVDEESLDAVESFLLARYRGPGEALRLDERGVIDAAARHIGLVFLLNVDGAKWAINLENEDRAFYRLPVIRFPDGDEACPLALATAALDRRTGEYLRTVVENYEAQYNTATDE